MTGLSRFQQELLKEAFEIIGGATPLATDCGALCDAVCCKGEGGMLLFPGEADMLSGLPGFRLYRVPYGLRRVWWLSCAGYCDREIRPLACRMYPLAPRVDAEGQVSAWRDLRAIGTCPIVRAEPFDPRFEDAVEKAFRLLARDPAMLSFMRTVSDEIEALDRLIRLF